MEAVAVAASAAYYGDITHAATPSSVCRGLANGKQLSCRHGRLVLSWPMETGTYRKHTTL